jgi:hypothetical protein
MSAEVLLISEEKLKAFSAVNDNVRVEEIQPMVVQAQDLYLQPQLGTKFFTSLKLAVLNNTLTADQITLLDDYIAPMLLNRAFALALPFLKYKIVDKGVLSGTSETATQTTLDELQYLISKVESTAEFYAQRLREFLLDNPGMFADYENPGTDGMYPNRRTPYFSGLTVPAKKGSGTYKYYNGYDTGLDDCFCESGLA